MCVEGGGGGKTVIKNIAKERLPVRNSSIPDSVCLSEGVRHTLGSRLPKVSLLWANLVCLTCKDSRLR